MKISIDLICKKWVEALCETEILLGTELLPRISL